MGVVSAREEIVVVVSTCVRRRRAARLSRQRTSKQSEARPRHDEVSQARRSVVA
jgi:hypothetical protein